MVTLTVGIPFTRVDSYLDMAIESVRNQTFPDWELILYGDGVDPVALEELAERWPDEKRIRVLGHTAKRGLAAVLNDIAHLADGKYLFRMDADDIMLPRRLSDQLALLRSYNNDNVVLSGGAIVINESNQVCGELKLLKYSGARRELLHSSIIVHPTVASTTDWFLRNPYDSEFSRAQDKELWLRASSHTRFIVDPRPFVFYRIADQVQKFPQSSQFNRAILRRYARDLVGPARFAVLMTKEFVLSSMITNRVLQNLYQLDMSISSRCYAMSLESSRALQAELDAVVRSRKIPPS